MGKKDDIDREIATLIFCTHRKRRPRSITEIADIIESLRRKLGSYEAVSERVNLSTEMLREFRSVRLLDPTVRALVEQRAIDSVDLVYRISKLEPKKQRAIANKFLKDQLTGNDVRAIRSFKKGKEQSAREVISKITKSRNIRVYILQFKLPDKTRTTELRKRFERILGRTQIVDLRAKNGVASLGLSYRGQKRLREAAKKKKMTLRRFVNRFVERKQSVGKVL